MVLSPTVMVRALAPTATRGARLRVFVRRTFQGWVPLRTVYLEGDTAPHEQAMELALEAEAELRRELGMGGPGGMLGMALPDGDGWVFAPWEG